ncbi:MAG: MFS transporter [Acidimicrobiia bacterium]|nr:MFS transporter [Acidimicrobiia bacterium]MDH4306088.1 MFS transporter [Acidimicrobiia bacterium]
MSIARAADDLGWRPLIPIAMVMFIIALDTTMLNVAIPDIVKDLDTTTSAVQSAVALYSLVMAALMVGAGRLGDIVGSKRLYRIALVVFGAGTLTATLAPNVAVLIFGWSFLEGVGAAALIPISIAMISINYDGSRRAVAFGIVGGFQAVAAATGPIVGGFLATNLSWRVAFGFEAVVVVIVIVLLKHVIGAPARPELQLDWRGVMLWASGLISIVLSVLLAGYYGWWSARRPFSLGGSEIPLWGFSPTPVLALAGLCILVGFVHWTRRRVARGEVPLFSFGTLSNVNYRTGIATDALESLLIAGLLFIVPVFLQSGRGYTALEAGVALLPFSFAILVGALGLPKLGEVLSPKLVIQVGTVLIVVGLIWYRAVSAGAFSRVDLTGPFVVIGLGIGGLLSQVANVTLSGVADEERGSATGVYNTGKELGTSLGTAIIGTAMLASFFSFYVNTSALEIGQDLSPQRARVLAIELEDAEQRLDDDQLVELVQTEIPQFTISDINRIADDSWTQANRRAVESALVVAVLTLITSTFLQRSDGRR